MSDAQDLPQARCNVTSMVRTTRSKAHGSLRRAVPTRRTVLRLEKSSLYIYERARRGSWVLKLSVQRASARPAMWVGVRISGIELMKATNVWRIENALIRRVLLRRAIGCTASEKEHWKHKE